PARLVCKVAREVNRLTDNTAALRTSLQRAIVCILDDDRNEFELAFLFVLRAILVRLKESHHCTGDRDLCNSVRSALGTRRDGNRLHVLASQKTSRCSAHLRYLRRFVFITLATA